MGLFVDCRFNDELFSSAINMPNRIFIFLLDNGQFHGNRRKNPFWFRRNFTFYKNGRPVSNVYVKRATLTIQGYDLSGYNCDATEDDDPVGYRRLNKVCGWMNLCVSAGITKRKFNDNFYLSCWDMTTSRQTVPDFSMKFQAFDRLTLN